MSKLTAALLAAVLMALKSGPVTAADEGGTRKRKAEARPYNSAPSVIAERQRDKRTFDETQYFERLSERIPFGSDAWWRQKQVEDANE